MRVAPFNLLLLFILAAASYGCTTKTSEIDQAPTQDQKAAEINTQLGVRYLAQGDYELADEKLRKALEQDNKYATAHWVFALLQERLGEEKVAEKHFRKAIHLDPKDSRAHNNYGAFLCKQDRIGEAEKEFLLAIDNPLYTQADSAYVNAGLCVLKTPDVEKAEQYFKQALTINPRQQAALYQMASISFDRKEYELVMDYIRNYEKIAKHTSESLWIAYQSEVKLGQESNAENYATQLKIQYPSSEEAKLLAESYWHAGRKK